MWKIAGFSNFGDFGSSGNLGNLFSGHAMTAITGAPGDSSLSRLPIYSITKSAMAIPAILFPLSFWQSWQSLTDVAR
jgi:hypothetical protein